MTQFAPIEVSAATVHEAGVSVARLCIWAVEKANAGKSEQAVRLLTAAIAMVEHDAQRDG